MGSFGKAAMTVNRSLRKIVGPAMRKGLASIDSSQLRMNVVKNAAKILARKPMTPVRMKLFHPMSFKQNFGELYAASNYISESYFGLAEGIRKIQPSSKMSGTFRNIRERILNSRALRLKDTKLGNMNITPTQPLNMGPTMATRLFSGKNPFFDKFSRFQ